MIDREEQYTERVILRVPAAGDLSTLINERLSISRGHVRATEDEIQRTEARLEGLRREAVKGREEVRYWEEQLEDTQKPHGPRAGNSINISGPVSSHEVAAAVQNGIDARLRTERED